MLRLRQSWRTYLDHERWLISAEMSFFAFRAFCLHCFLGWKQVPFFMKSWPVESVTTTTPQQCIECILIFRMMLLSAETTFATFLHLSSDTCDMWHQQLAVWCLSDLPTPTHPRLLLATEKDLRHWHRFTFCTTSLHMRVSGKSNPLFKCLY